MPPTPSPDTEQGLRHVRAAPADHGHLALIVARPEEGRREVLDHGRLDTGLGLVGDNWVTRTTRLGPPQPDRQVTLMSARAAEVLLGDEERWALAGDQLYVDLDLSEANLPAGSRVSIGGATLAITAAPHLGCAKFRDRFGAEALAVVNSAEGRSLRLRGANARVTAGGTIRCGDAVTVPNVGG